MATRLISILTFLSFTACGKSPWSDYVKENNLTRDSGSKKPITSCPLLDFNQIVWLQGPFVTPQESEFNITFQQPPDFQLQIELFMPSMGHGSAPVTITPLDELNYNITRVFFTMHGTWEVRIQDSRNILCRFEIEI